MIEPIPRERALVPFHCLHNNFEMNATYFMHGDFIFGKGFQWGEVRARFTCRTCHEPLIFLGPYVDEDPRYLGAYVDRSGTVLRFCVGTVMGSVIKTGQWGSRFVLKEQAK